MDALLTCFALFGFWLVVGYAVTSRCLARRQAVPNLLLAPAVGMAVSEIVFFAVLRCGVSLNAVCGPLAAGLFVAAAASLVAGRVPVAPHRYAPFAVVLVAAYLLNGWPQLRYGSDWVGFASYDMSNYCMLAAGYGDRGVLLTPDDWALGESGRDHTQSYRFQFVMLYTRLGGELSLAALSRAAGCQPVEACMPLALAMHLALVSAGGFLAYRGRRGRWAALGACVFLAASAPSAFGILEQMLGQIGGLAMLCGCVGVLCRPAHRLPAAALARRVVLGGVLVAGLVLHYPEVLPFLAATVAGLAGVGLLRGRVGWRRLGAAAAAAAAVPVLLGSFAINTAAFMIDQLLIGSRGTSVGAFLHDHHTVYNSAQGVLLFWGARSRVDPTLHTAPGGVSWPVAVGAAGFLACAAVGAVLTWRRRPVWVMLAVMAAATALLFSGRGWFGVHKMGMYAQPFLAVALGGLFAVRHPFARGLAFAVFAVAVAANGRAQFEYTSDSTREGGRTSLAGASESGLVTELRTTVAASPAERVWVTTENPLLARFLVVPLRGREATFTTHRQFVNLASEFAGPPDRPRGDDLLDDTPAWVADPAPTDYLLAAGPGQSALNYSRYSRETAANLLMRPLRDVRNHLVLRESRQSKLVPLPFAVFDPAAALACDAPAKDPLLPGHGRAVYLGPRLTLQVVNPSPKVRVVLASSALIPAWAGKLPSGAVTGATAVPIEYAGGGSGRLVTPPLELAIEHGARVLRLALGRENGPAEGLVTLCRDLSVVTEEEYDAYRPPVAIDGFPQGLTDPLLEYSGVVEDGWATDRVRARLTRPAGLQMVEIRGQVPGLTSDFRTEMTVLVDGVELGRRTLTAGAFAVRVPAAAVAAGPRWVECRFSNTQKLPAPDQRAVSAFLRSVGFAPMDEAMTRVPTKLASFPADLAHPLLEQAGILVDGWVGAGFDARLAAPAGHDAVVRGHVPGFPDALAFTTELTLLVDGVEVAKRVLKPGDFEVRAPVAGNAAQARRLECRFSQTQTLPPPDGRAAGALLRSVGFEPAAK